MSNITTPSAVMAIVQLPAIISYFQLDDWERASACAILCNGMQSRVHGATSGGWVGMEAKEEAGRPGQSRPWQNRTGQGSLLNSIWQYSAIFKSGCRHDNALRPFFALCGCACVCVCVYPRDFTIRAVMCGNF